MDMKLKMIVLTFDSPVRKKFSHKTENSISIYEIKTHRNPLSLATSIVQACLPITNIEFLVDNTNSQESKLPRELVE